MKNHFGWVVVCAGACLLAEARAESPKLHSQEFAFQVYQKTKDAPGNLFFSPYSLRSALAMTYGGASGETAREMAKVLGLVGTPAVVHGEQKKLSDSLKQGVLDSQIQLNIANRLWAQKDYAFLESYLNLTRSFYNASAVNLDFVGQTQESRRQINSWVEEQTQKKIVELIPEGSIGALTRLVLTNAVYFKADWESPFKHEMTMPHDFTLRNGSKVSVPLMSQEIGMPYYEDAHLQAVDFAYQGGKWVMTVLLPRTSSKEALAQFENRLRGDPFLTWLKAMKPVLVDFRLPSFKMTWGQSVKTMLAAMGMRHALDANLADFSGMTGKKGLFISDVIHKAFVEVNEKGTEAAAATAVMMNLTSAIMDRPEPKRFVADHPFVFLIRERSTGTILFMGRWEDPR